jgi:hypothetical protein
MGIQARGEKSPIASQNVPFTPPVGWEKACGVNDLEAKSGSAAVSSMALDLAKRVRAQIANIRYLSPLTNT